MGSPASGKMTAYRARLRAQGLRPIQAWVPDLRQNGPLRQLRADIARVRGHASERDGDGFLDAALEELQGWE
jgi:hypothetical protein